METGRPLMQNAMYAAERSALHAKDMHGKSRRNNYCRLYMRKGHFMKNKKNLALISLILGIVGCLTGVVLVGAVFGIARDHIIRKFEKSKGPKAVSDRYYHRSCCDRLHDSPLCLGRTASGGDAEGTAPSSDYDVERSAGRRYGEHCAGHNSDTDAVPEADR